MLLFWILACGGDDLPSDTPACISDVIAELEAAPVRNPPSSMTEYVIDGDRSLVWQQAGNRMHAARALLVELMQEA